MNDYPIYMIIDRDGTEMPRHYSGRLRTYDEAKKIVDSLNKDGEYAPYKMIPIDKLYEHLD